MHYIFLLTAATLAFILANCGDSATKTDWRGSPNEYQTPDHNQTGLPPSSPQAANATSWDGSWNPEFPVAGMTDELYDTLPPGKWGWSNSCDCAVDSGLHIYQNEFLKKGLRFIPLLDSAGELYGWKLLDTDAGGIDLDHRGDQFEGSPGMDVLDLNPGGALHSSGPSKSGPGIHLGDGPDILRFETGYSLDMRTGSDTHGALYDNDLVILGREDTLGLNEYDIHGTTIHTGPGSDLVFARNFGPAAIDLGNGLAGRTDVLDSADGDDMVILSGNMRDFRIFGGYGNDVAVWYVDEINDDRWIGSSFYGAGAWGDAIWTDPGKDRLILAIDPLTLIVTKRSDHDNNPGSLLVFIYKDYSPSIDGPTEQDAYARYYGTAPTGPQGQRTFTFSYRSANGKVFTHDCYLTAFEELQLGTGSDARVYTLDPIRGAVTLSDTLQPLTQIPQRHEFNDYIDQL